MRMIASIVKVIHMLLAPLLFTYRVVSIVIVAMPMTRTGTTIGIVGRSINVGITHSGRGGSCYR